MRLILRLMAICGAAVAIAVLTVALVSGETEPIVRDIVLDGAIDRSLAQPMPTTYDGPQPPPAVPAIEQIEPAPTPSPPMPAADPLAAPPAVTFIPPASETSDDEAEGMTDDVADPPAGDDDPGSGGDDPDD